jgi:hypothetical protein
VVQPGVEGGEHVTVQDASQQSARSVALHGVSPHRLEGCVQCLRRRISRHLFIVDGTSRTMNE